jgi:hypothetical protein
MGPEAEAYTTVGPFELLPYIIAEEVLVQLYSMLVL